MCIVSEPVVGGDSPLAVRLEHNNHRKSFTLVYTLDVYSWQTYRSNWSIHSCDRFRCPKYSKAFSMSSSQALNNLTHHSLVLPATRPCPILFEQASIVSLKYVCVLICYALVGLACFSSRFASLSSFYMGSWGVHYSRLLWRRQANGGITKCDRIYIPVGRTAGYSASVGIPVVTPLHYCHHLQICPPPAKQYITTHRNTEFIVMYSPCRGLSCRLIY